MGLKRRGKFLQLFFTERERTRLAGAEVVSLALDYIRVFHNQIGKVSGAVYYFVKR